MKEPGNQKVLKIVKTLATIAILLAALSLTVSPTLAGDDDDVNFLTLGHGYTEDYYRSYGEPEIGASITGNPEFERGELADLEVKIVNKGVIEGFKRLYVNQSQIPDSQEELLALDEMEEEEDCNIARGIKASLVSENEYIKVEATTSIRNLEELKSGHSDTLRFTIRIDNDIPAGDYELKLPVSYEYQSNVKTVTSNVLNLGLTDTDFMREYTKKESVLILPISIKEEPKFEVSKVSGSLKQGETSAVRVTYTNIGETSAEDAMARIIVMSPLSTEKSVVRLGPIGPGESKTATFNISAESDAVVKNYGIDSELRYIDKDGETSFSENLKVGAPLEPAEKKASVLGISLILIILIAIYQVVNVFRNRKKYSDNKSGDENE